MKYLDKQLYQSLESKLTCLPYYGCLMIHSILEAPSHHPKLGFSPPALSPPPLCLSLLFSPLLISLRVLFITYLAHLFLTHTTPVPSQQHRFLIAVG